MLFSFIIAAATLGTVLCKQDAQSQFSLGAIKHKSLLYNVVVSEQSFVGRLFGNSIYKVEQVDLQLQQSPADPVAVAGNEKLDYVTVPMIKSFLDSAGLYFGHAGDKHQPYKLWTSMACNMNSQKCPVSGDVDYENYFVNNLEMLKVATENRVQANTVKAIRGIISMKCFTKDTHGRQICATVMSRTSAYRTAPRMFSRGADLDGHVGNCAEVETIIANGRNAASFLQFRGSIPFIWSQPPTWWDVMPTVKIHENETENYQSFSKHMTHLQRLFPAYTQYKVLSLIDAEGMVERELASTFAKFFADYNAQHGNGDVYKFVPFTFNASVKKKDNTDADDDGWQEPWFNSLKQDVGLDEVGFTVVDARRTVVQHQAHIIRSSCLSTLDRTSAVQRQLSDHQTLGMINAVMAFSPDGTKLAEAPVLKKPPRDMLKWFARCWVDLANTIAFQYAGTDAKKTDIILTGKSTKLGRLHDYTVLTAKRHLNANYFDYEKRDVMEVIYGDKATRMY